MIGLRSRFLLFFFFLSVATLYAYDDGDFQIWHTEAQEMEINQKWKVAANQEFRWGDDASELYYQHYELGLVYALNKNLDLGLNYRQILERDSKKKFRQENMPNIYGTLKWSLFGFKFDDRNRLEYRNFETKNAIWRYRNKFNVKLPWKFTRFEIQPYLADEIFINFNSTGFNRNRFYSGFGISLTKNLKGEIYYLLQSTDSSGTWIKANVLGSKFKLVF
ncbi:MAG: DUF2490 domain-containing protein [Candidatus Omnitrophica bacterium]|jgi:hypothetical protein|nr:DUF2490 domain-containing protein [Candidatus Omnitrophota bacterium]